MAPACFRSEIFVVVVTLVLATGVGWMTINREAGYSVSHRSYQDLYSVADSLVISGFERSSKGVLDVRLSSLRGDGPAVSKTRQPVAHVTIQQGRHPHDLEYSGERIGSAFWTMWGPEMPRVLIGNPTINIGERAFSVDDFASASEAHPRKEVDEALNLLSSRFDVRQNESAAVKIRKIASALHRDLYPHRGVPRAYMRRLNGFRQYQEALAGRSEVYCANHAEIFAFFANLAGVPTRIVDVAGEVDGLALGAHSFTESYDAETGRWRYVDLQLSILGILDESGGYLNAADLIHRQAGGTAATLLVDEMGLDHTERVAYAERGKKIGLFLHPQTTLVYLWASKDRFHPMERLQRLLLTPRPGYSLRSTGSGAVVRIVLTWALIVLFGIWIILRLRHMIGRCSCFS